MSHRDELKRSRSIASLFQRMNSEKTIAHRSSYDSVEGEDVWLECAVMYEIPRGKTINMGFIAFFYDEAGTLLTHVSIGNREHLEGGNRVAYFEEEGRSTRKICINTTRLSQSCAVIVVGFGVISENPQICLDSVEHLGVSIMNDGEALYEVRHIDNSQTAAMKACAQCVVLRQGGQWMLQPLVRFFTPEALLNHQLSDPLLTWLRSAFERYVEYLLGGTDVDPYPPPPLPKANGSQRGNSPARAPPALGRASPEGESRRSQGAGTPSNDPEIELLAAKMMELEPNWDGLDSAALQRLLARAADTGGPQTRGVLRRLGSALARGRWGNRDDAELRAVQERMSMETRALKTGLEDEKRNTERLNKKIQDLERERDQEMRRMQQQRDASLKTASEEARRLVEEERRSHEQELMRLRTQSDATSMQRMTEEAALKRDLAAKETEITEKSKALAERETELAEKRKMVENLRNEVKEAQEAARQVTMDANSSKSRTEQQMIAELARKDEEIAALKERHKNALTHTEGMLNQQILDLRAVGDRERANFEAELDRRRQEFERMQADNLRTVTELQNELREVRLAHEEQLRRVATDMDGKLTAVDADLHNTVRDLKAGFERERSHLLLQIKELQSGLMRDQNNHAIELSKLQEQLNSERSNRQEQLREAQQRLDSERELHRATLKRAEEDAVAEQLRVKRAAQESLTDARAEHAAAMERQAEETRTALERQRLSLEAREARTQAEHECAMAALRKVHEEALAELKARYDSTARMREAQFTERERAIKEELNHTLEEMTGRIAAKDREVASVRDASERTISRLQNEMSTRLHDARLQHDQELASVRHKAEEDGRRVQAEFETSRAQLETLVDQLRQQQGTSSQVLHARHTEAVASLRTEYEGRVQALESLLSAERLEFQAQMSDVRAENERAMTAMRNERDATVERLKLEHNDVVSRLRHDFEDTVERLAAAHAEEVRHVHDEFRAGDSALRNAHSTENEEIRRYAELRIEKLMAAHAREMEKLRSDAARALETASADFERELEIVRSELTSSRDLAVAELTETRRRTEQTLTTMLTEREAELERVRRDSSERERQILEVKDTQLAAVREELTSLLQSLKLDAANAIEHLEQDRIASITKLIDELTQAHVDNGMKELAFSQQLQQAQDRVAALEKTLAVERDEREQVDQSLRSAVEADLRSLIVAHEQHCEEQAAEHRRVLLAVRDECARAVGDMQAAFDEQLRETVAAYEAALEGARVQAESQHEALKSELSRHHLHLRSAYEQKLADVAEAAESPRVHHHVARSVESRERAQADEAAHAVAAANQATARAIASASQAVANARRVASRGSHVGNLRQRVHATLDSIVLPHMESAPPGTRMDIQVAADARDVRPASSATQVSVRVAPHAVQQHFNIRPASAATPEPIAAASPPAPSPPSPKRIEIWRNEKRREHLGALATSATPSLTAGLHFQAPQAPASAPTAAPQPDVAAPEASRGRAVSPAAAFLLAAPTAREMVLNPHTVLRTQRLVNEHVANPANRYFPADSEPSPAMRGARPPHGRSLALSSTSPTGWSALGSAASPSFSSLSFQAMSADATPSQVLREALSTQHRTDVLPATPTAAPGEAGRAQVRSELTQSMLRLLGAAPPRPAAASAAHGSGTQSAIGGVKNLGSSEGTSTPSTRFTGLLQTGGSAVEALKAARAEDERRASSNQRRAFKGAAAADNKPVRNDPRTSGGVQFRFYE